MMRTDPVDGKKFRSIGIGEKNPDDIIRQVHYNTSYVGYKANPLDISYSLIPNITPDDKPQSWFQKHIMLVVTVSFLAFTIIAIMAALIFKRRKGKERNVIEHSQSEVVNPSFIKNVQTLSTVGRGTETDANSENPYQSILEERELLMNK